MEELIIELKEKIIDALNLEEMTPDDIATAVRNANQSAPGGTIRRGQFRFSVRALTEFRSPAEIGDTPVGPARAGIRLRDVARVELGSENYSGTAYYDGKPSIPLAILEMVLEVAG